MNKLSVAIDGARLETPLTGIGQYTRHLVDNLRQADPYLGLHILISGKWCSASAEHPIHRETGHEIKSGIVKLTNAMGWRAVLARKYLTAAIKQRRFTQGIGELQPDLVHGPCHYLPKTCLPSVVTIHDISCFRYPQTHPRARVEWENRTLPKTLDRANHILTVSNFSKQELMEFFDVPADKITVTPNGVGEEFFSAACSPSLSSILGEYQLTSGHYILTVGTLEPRKNLGTLIDAYSRLSPSIRARLPLIIVGMKGWGNECQSKQIDKMTARGELRFPGYVPQAHLPFLYAGARLFAFPSIYEGFGIPVIEAMATGTPVITTNRSSLPEVAGTAGICIPAMDTERWTAELTRLIEDAAAHAELSSAGVDRAREYCWSRTAQITLDVYHSVI